MLERFSILVFAILCAAPASAQDAPEPQRVLVLNSYTPTFPTTDALLRGIREGLGDARVALEVEFIASKAAWDETYARTSLELLRNRLRHRQQYALVIATDDHAVDLLALDAAETLTAPVVAVGVNHPRVLASLPRSRATGAIERIDMVGTLELARQLQPELERVVLVVDGSQSGAGHLELVRKEVGQGILVDSVSLAEHGLDGVTARLRSYDLETAVVILSAHLTRAREISYASAHEQLCAGSGAPCYTPFRFAIDVGPVGGSIIDMADHGRIAGEYARAILSGRAPADLPIVEGTPATKLVVARALERWPELAARVPNGVVVRKPEDAAPPASPGSLVPVLVALAAAGLLVAWLVRRRVKREPPAAPREPAAQTRGDEDSELGLAAVGRVASSMVHDLNNLLTVVRGYGDLIEGDQDASANVRESAGQILAASERASRLAHRVLSFMRSHSEQVRVVVVREHVQDLASVLQMMLSRDVSFHLGIDPDFTAVRIDPVALDQVILNLVSNARDAGATKVEASVARETRGSPSEMLTGTIPAGEWAVLRVVDNGKGVDESQLARLTEEYYSTKGDSGTGIGLATVSRIVREAGGGFTVRPQSGGGVCAEICLPALSEDEAVELRKPLLERAGRIRGSGIVWVVDDDRAVRELIVRSLSEFGYEVRAWSRPSEIVQAVGREGQPDILVLDLHLPEMSGTELYEELTRHQGRALPAVFVSGTPEHVGTHEASVLGKPFDAFELVATVHRAAARR